MYILDKISLLFLVLIQLVGVETLSYCMILELDINHWICMTWVTVIWFIVGKNSCWGSILSSVATIWCFPQLVYDNTCAHCILIPKNCIKGNIKPQHTCRLGNFYYVHLLCKIAQSVIQDVQRKQIFGLAHWACKLKLSCTSSKLFPPKVHLLPVVPL